MRPDIPVNGSPSTSISPYSLDNPVRYRFTSLCTVSLSKLIEKANERDVDIRTDDPYLMILLHSSYAFRRWRNHPRYDKICKDIDQPEISVHNVPQLAIAAFLQDLGNGIALAPETQKVRRCDLWISGGPSNLVSLEVKSRNELRTLKFRLSPDYATKAIRATLDSAGIPGLGGFALSS